MFAIKKKWVIILICINTIIILACYYAPRRLFIKNKHGEYITLWQEIFDSKYYIIIGKYTSLTKPLDNYIKINNKGIITIVKMDDKHFYISAYGSYSIVNFDTISYKFLDFSNETYLFKSILSHYQYQDNNFLNTDNHWTINLEYLSIGGINNEKFTVEKYPW